MLRAAARGLPRFRRRTEAAMKRWLGGVAVLVLLGGVAAFVCRDGLKARYYTHKLFAAAEADVADWVDQAPSWGDGVTDRLTDCLATDDPAACARAGAALARLTNSGRADILGRLADRFARLSPAGQEAALDCVAPSAAEDGPDATAACRQIVRLALQHADAAVRLRAATLALRPTIGQPEWLVPLLRDPAAEVRRVAILAIAPARELVADDDLLRWLHDSDADVRRLTETALRSRGLRPRDVRLGRLLTDPRPAGRLELLVLLQDDGELDLSAWLRRLSEDPAPAVRAAAARLADERQVFQLADRLTQMATSDPDLTVRQAVTYHLGRLQSPVRPVSGP
jgi:hypothetical protein